MLSCWSTRLLQAHLQDEDTAPSPYQALPRPLDLEETAAVTTVYGMLEGGRLLGVFFDASFGTMMHVICMSGVTICMSAGDRPSPQPHLNLTSFHVGSGQPSAFSFEEVVVEMVEGLEDPELRLAGFWHSHLALISGLEGRFTADFD